MKFFDNVDVLTSRSIHHMPYTAIFYIFVLLAYVLSSHLGVKQHVIGVENDRLDGQFLLLASVAEFDDSLFGGFPIVRVVDIHVRVTRHLVISHPPALQSAYGMLI